MWHIPVIQHLSKIQAGDIETQLSTQSVKEIEQMCCRLGHCAGNQYQSLILQVAERSEPIFIPRSNLDRIMFWFAGKQTLEPVSALRGRLAKHVALPPVSRPQPGAQQYPFFKRHLPEMLFDHLKIFIIQLLHNHDKQAFHTG
ncbi:Uncharacterised protein [Klebsiella pneumoniae]|nr:Uncharacterised protein [Klebsiella pneumoniae]